VIEQGPVRNITESVLVFGASRIVLHTIAYARWRVLEFRLRVHWNEERKRLKLSVPTSLPDAALQAEVAGGAIWRQADAQEHLHRRWLILTGVLDGQETSFAVINNGQNGYDFAEGEVRLSALRSAAYCHEQGFALGVDAGPARKFMDQGVHELHLLVTVGAPDDVRRRIPGLADWLSAAPVAYTHLPIGSCAQPLSGHDTLVRLTPTHLRMLACKQSWDGEALVVRVQETMGEPTQGELAIEEGIVLPFALGPWEIKTLRIDRTGARREVHMIRET
jgi:alpha-mannosidase